MNPRIRELANRADSYAYDIDQEQGAEYRSAYTQKFAELLVADCARLLSDDSAVFPELGGYAHDICQRYGVDFAKI